MRSVYEEMDWADVAAVSVLARTFGVTPREWLAQLDMWGLNNICAAGIREGAWMERERCLEVCKHVDEHEHEGVRTTVESLLWERAVKDCADGIRDGR
jgi:uncharacterized protein (UPF0276 family)